MPMPRSGNFADVYQVRGADGRMWAVKCFTRPVAGLRERYPKIDAHLRKRPACPFTVGFEFLPEGIRIRGLWYPVLKMEWVEGLHAQRVRPRERRQAGASEGAAAACGCGCASACATPTSPTPTCSTATSCSCPARRRTRSSLRLIDYDGMWVPALAEQSVRRSGPSGLSASAAAAASGLYTADVDRFPHLVIGCALRALAVAGRAALGPLRQRRQPALPRSRLRRPGELGRCSGRFGTLTIRRSQISWRF